MKRLRPRAWRDLFPTRPPVSPAPQWWTAAEVAATPDASDFWPQLTRLADPKFERPTARRDVEVETLAEAKGVILSDATRGIYLHLTPEDLFIWERLDGTRNQIDLVVDYCMRFKALAPARIASVVELLRAEGLLTGPPDELYPKLHSRLTRYSFTGAVAYLTQTFLQREVAVSGIDGVLGRLYRGGVWVLYTGPVQILFWLVALLGLGAFGYLTVTRQFSVLGQGTLIEGGVTLFVFTTLALILHEAAHAFTVKAFGRRVRRAGLFILLGLIGAFVDTTDIWPAGKRAQLWVTWAGPFVNAILGGLAALVIVANPQASFAPLAFQFAVSQYGLVLLNLTPFLRLDGYYLLSDALGVPNLSSRASGFLSKVLPRRWRQAWAEGHVFPSLNREEKILVVFGGLSAFWIANLMGLGVLVAPVRLVETVGQFLTGGFAGASLLTIIFAVVGLIFTATFLVRSIQTARAGMVRVGRSLQTASGWRVALVLGAITLLIAAIPDLLIAQGGQRAVQAGQIYAHGIALVSNLLLAIYAARLAQELKGAGLRPVLGGLLLTALAWLGIGLAALMSPDQPWPMLRLLALAPLLVSLLWMIRWVWRLRGAPLGWALWLGLLAMGALALAATRTRLTDGHWLTLIGQTFLFTSVLMHWQLAHRPLALPRVPTQVETMEPDRLLRQAVYAVARELTQSLGEVAGPKALRELAFNFNNQLANTDWPIWLTMKGGLGEKFSGPIDDRATMYRAALDELRRRMAGRLGQGFVDGAQAQALAELPAPLRAIFRRWMLEEGVPVGEGDTDDDRVRLRLAGRRLAETMVLGCSRIYGWRMTDGAIRNFNRAAATANWPLYIRGNGRLADELKGDLLSLTQIYGEALQTLLSEVATIAGPAFVERGVVMVYDGLPWEAREVAAQLFLSHLSWARQLNAGRAPNPRLAFLRTVPLLGWLPPDEVARLAAHLKPRMVRAGQVVLARATYPDLALIVRQGSVQALAATNTLQRPIEQIGAGGLIGVRSIVDDQPLPYTYVAQTEVEVWPVPARYVMEHLRPLLLVQDAVEDPHSGLALLTRIPLFAALDPAQRARVAQAMEVQHLAPNAVVLQEGAASQGFFIVQAGELEVVVGTSGGERRVSTLGPGEFFGETALLNRTPVTATVRARTSVEVLRLTPADFYALLGSGLTTATLDQVQSRRAKERWRVSQLAVDGNNA